LTELRLRTFKVAESEIEDHQSADRRAALQIGQSLADIIISAALSETVRDARPLALSNYCRCRSLQLMLLSPVDEDTLRRLTLSADAPLRTPSTPLTD